MAKMKIIFDGFADLAYRIDKAGGDLHAAVDEALTATEKLVQDNLEPAVTPYASKGRKGYATGEMYASRLTEARIDWKGMIAEVDVGFDLLSKGGYHSIFIMYGTPKIAKDAKIYNAIKGARTKKMIAEKQKEVMLRHLDLGGN